MHKGAKGRETKEDGVEVVRPASAGRLPFIAEHIINKFRILPQFMGQILRLYGVRNDT